jgi:hypothetical protein
MSSCSRLIAPAIVFVLTATALAGPQTGRPTTTMARAEHPVERQIREQFPSVAFDSQAAIEPAQESVAGQTVSGMRARQPRSTTSAHPLATSVVDGDPGNGLRVFYPASYGDAFVIELGDQRVAVRAVGAHFAQGAAAAGKLFYTNPHDSVDVIEVPSSGRSEELLLLRDEHAPKVFEYEIVETRAVSALLLQDGAIRFAPEHIATAAEVVSGQSVAPLQSIQIDRPWVIDADGRRSESAARWTILEKKGAEPQRIRLTLDSENLAYPMVIDPSVSVTGNMTTRRGHHTATLLSNGKVLMAGGHSNGVYPNTAELYDPATGTFTATGNMTAARYDHTATLLPNGKVLITGGFDGGASNILDSAELFDPAGGTNGMFTAVAVNMTAARQLHAATLLPNGKVLIAGGRTTGSAYLNTAELYDPSSGTNGSFTAVAVNMTASRSSQIATLLPNGKVLLTGGETTGVVYLSSAELYDPALGTNGTFTAVAVNMTSMRGYHKAILLPNGLVLITGGLSNSSTIVNTAELYNPLAGTNGTFTATGAMTTARAVHTATLLPNGKVLVAGGLNTGGYLNVMELFDPAAGTNGTFSPTPSNLIGPFTFHTATLLPSGKVLVAGGSDSGGDENAAELYDPASGAQQFSATSGPMTAARQDHTSTLLSNGKVLLTGGYAPATNVTGTAELYDPSANAFSATSSPMTSVREDHTATLLLNGLVLIAGGSDGLHAQNTGELYNPSSGTPFTATSSPMTSARQYHTATLLPDGKVLIVGGDDQNGSSLNTAELYDPIGFTSFTPISALLNHNRVFHTATLLHNGKVLIAGGISGLTAELYDPASGTFAATGSMSVVRQFHRATLLPNGRVLITGGNSTSTTAELFDPAAGTNGTFTAVTAAMTSPRFLYHTATLLPGGQVLITGGQDSSSALNTAELYDPDRGTNGTFTAIAATMTTARNIHTATLLPNGKVLIAGGTSGTSAELFNAGLGYLDSRRPVVSSPANLFCQPAHLSLSGSFFTSDSEGSSGSTSSAANAPLLRLQSIEGDRFQFALSQTTSASSFFSATLSGLPSGQYRTAIVSNAIPSVEKIVELETLPLLGTYATTSINVSSSTTVTPTTLPPGYNGAFYRIQVNASGGFTGTLVINATTGVVTVTNAGPIGTYTITVSSSNICSSPTSLFTLNVLGPPAAITATGGTPQSAQTSNAFAIQLQAKVTDSAGHPLNNAGVAFTAPSQSGASATLPNGGNALTNSSGIASITATANGILGSYNVTVTIGAFNATFALTNIVATPTNIVATATSPTSVLITWNGTAGATYQVTRVQFGNVLVTAGSSTSGSVVDSPVSPGTAYVYKVRATSPGVSAFGTPDLATTVIFTDPSLVAGIGIKAAHITELRTAVDAVRALAGLGGGSYTTDPTITSGGTIIRAAHVNELRTALDQARASTTAPMPLPAIVYTRPNIVIGMTIFASDINDLRNGVR